MPIAQGGISTGYGLAAVGVGAFYATGNDENFLRDQGVNPGCPITEQVPGMSTGLLGMIVLFLQEPLRGQTIPYFYAFFCS